MYTYVYIVDLTQLHAYILIQPHLEKRGEIEKKTSREKKEIQI